MNTVFPQCVVDAFQKCPNVQHVEVQTEWRSYDQPITAKLESLLPVFQSSGFAARRLSTLLLRPSCPVQDDRGLDHQNFLLRLFEALGNARNPVPHVTLGRGCVTPMAGLESAEARRLPLRNCFQYLTTLTLWVSTSFPTDSPFLVGCFAPALKKARNLMHLQVGASNTTKYEHYDTYRLELFALLQDCVFPRLVTLALTGMIASVQELLTLFKNHKNLESLSLTALDLRVYPTAMLDATAVGTKDLMSLLWNTRRLMDLTELIIEPPWRLQLHQHEWAPIDADFAGFKQRFEQFVLDRGPVDLAAFQGVTNF
ncbi:MAG: hypothetical protein Q9166_001641 [cf. Caloplaca sp. 2 TL-2023]